MPSTVMGLIQFTIIPTWMKENVVRVKKVSYIENLCEHRLFQ